MRFFFQDELPKWLSPLQIIQKLAKCQIILGQKLNLVIVGRKNILF